MLDNIFNLFSKREVKLEAEPGTYRICPDGEDSFKVEQYKFEYGEARWRIPERNWRYDNPNKVSGTEEECERYIKFEIDRANKVSSHAKNNPPREVPPFKIVK